MDIIGYVRSDGQKVAITAGEILEAKSKLFLEALLIKYAQPCDVVGMGGHFAKAFHG